MLTAERRLAADASHQLRTPLTALSMRLEEIIAHRRPGHGEGGGDHRAHPGGAAHRRGGTAAHQRPRPAQRLGRRLRPRRGRQAAGGGVAARLPQRRAPDRGDAGTRDCGRSATPGAVAQVLATLIENSLMHGDGTVAGHPRSPATRRWWRSRDEGPGVPPTWAPGSSSGRSAAATPRASASRWPGTSPRRTAAGWSWSSSSRRCSRSSSRPTRSRTIPWHPDGSAVTGLSTCRVAQLSTRSRCRLELLLHASRSHGTPTCGTTRTGTGSRDRCRGLEDVVRQRAAQAEHVVRKGRGTPLSMPRPTALNTKNSEYSRPQARLSRSRYVQ